MNNLLGNIEGSKLNFSFNKDERLCSKKIIDRLFLEGKSVFVFPIKIVYLETQIKTKFNAQAAFTVGKRNFKKAVHRNLIKRRMREAYRLNKSVFYNELGEKQAAVFFIFTGKSIPEYKQVEESIKKGLKKMAQEISGKNL